MTQAEQIIQIYSHLPAVAQQEAFKDNQIELQVQLNQETVWLNRQQLSLLFDRDIKTIGKPINNVLKEGELNENQAVAKFATTAKDGKIYQVDYYHIF